MTRDERCAWCEKALVGTPYPIHGPVACCSEPCRRAFYRAIVALLDSAKAAGRKGELVPA